MSGRERVKRALARVAGGGLPRGELFLMKDFLDARFGAATGDYVAQLRLAARELGLTAVGVDLDRAGSDSLLADRGYADLADYFVIGCVNGPFSRAAGSLGFTKALMQMRKDRESFLDLARPACRHIDEVCPHAHANGISAIAVADDIAGNGGLLFSVSEFNDLVLPLYREIATVIKEYGLFAFFHCDGNTERIVESLIDAGYDCIHPVDSQAGMSIGALQQSYGNRVSFMGHIDALAWDAARVSLEIDTAERKSDDGGLILGTSGGISAGSITPGLRALYPGLAISAAKAKQNDLAGGV